MIPRRLPKTNSNSFWAITAALAFSFILSACEGVDPQSDELVRNTKLELVDWHISGLWVINSPVAWIRVTNYNNVPIHDVTFEYTASALDGRVLSNGTYTVEGTVAPGGKVKNFIEQYLGIVDLYTEKLSVRLLSVRRAT